MRIFTLSLLLLFTGLIYSFIWGKNGLLENRSVESEIVVQKEVNNGLKVRNEEMFAEIDDLRQGLDAIEERARHELGLVKKGETFYRIIDEKPQREKE